MKPEGSEYNKEITVQEAAKHYNKGGDLILRFYNETDGWYASFYRSRYRIPFEILEDVTLDMLPDIRFFIKEE